MKKSLFFLAFGLALNLLPTAKAQVSDSQLIQEINGLGASETLPTMTKNTSTNYENLRNYGDHTPEEIKSVETLFIKNANNEYNYFMHPPYRYLRYKNQVLVPYYGRQKTAGKQKLAFSHLKRR